MAQPPAFPFYVQDYLTGTTVLSPAERGVYVDCLCYQWEVDGVPGDDVARLARVMRCTPAEARKLWPAIRDKFERGDDGLYRNARLEREREVKAAWQEAKRQSGRAGGLAKAQRKASTPSDSPGANGKQTASTPSDSPVANTLAKSSSSFFDLQSSVPSSSKNDDEGRGRARVVGVGVGIVPPADYDRLLRSHRYVGARLRVPHVLHGELISKLGGDAPDTALMAWYAELDEALERSRDPVPDVFAWLRPRFVQWAGARAGDAEMAKFIAGGV